MLGRVRSFARYLAPHRGPVRNAISCRSLHVTGPDPRPLLSETDKIRVTPFLLLTRVVSDP